MSVNEEIEQPQWFAHLEHDDDGNPILRDSQQQQFEHRLFRALTRAKSKNWHPIIRCCEGIYKDYMEATATKINASCWSIILFRGIPIALREDTESLNTIEILNQDDTNRITFKMERKDGQ